MGKDIQQFIDTPFKCNYPCHTQSVERRVALTTQAVSVIAGHKRQLGESLAIEHCRYVEPGRDSKRSRAIEEVENIEWGEKWL